MKLAAIILAAAVSGPPPYTGPLLARFFVPTVTVDGVSVMTTQWRCWTGSEWLPINGLACRRVLFGLHPLEPIPNHQRRME